MKNLLLIIPCLLAFSVSYAQDLILTTDDRLLEVKIISVNEILTFYTLKGKTGIKHIRNENIKGIKREVDPSKPMSKQELVKINGDRTSFLVKAPTPPKEWGNPQSLGFGILGISSFVGAVLLGNKGVSQKDGNVQNGYKTGALNLLGAGVGCVVISILTKKKSKKKKSLEPISMSSDPDKDILAYQQKEAVEKPYLSSSATGLGLQLNF